MGVVGLVMGVLSILGMCVAFIPLLGWMNWGVIPFAVMGLVISIVGMAARNNTIAGIVGGLLCVVAVIGGTIRLIIGCGIF